MNEVAEVEKVAPGCFGAASVFSHDSAVCRGCVVFDKCGEKARQRLEEIKELVNVSDLLKRHEKAKKLMAPVRAKRAEEDAAKLPQDAPKKKPVTTPVERKTTVAKVSFEIDEESKNVIAKISNQKAAGQAVILCKSNMIEIARSELAAGRNPFATSGPRYLFVACDMLLRGGFTRASLKQEMQQQLSWTESTAASHVSIVVGLFPAFNIIEAKGDAFILSPATE